MKQNHLIGVALGSSFFISLFFSRMQRVFKRAECNDRNYGAHREKLVRDILSSGLIEGVRGDAWALPEDVTESFAA